jgi:hypothetical protein
MAGAERAAVAQPPLQEDVMEGETKAPALPEAPRAIPSLAASPPVEAHVEAKPSAEASEDVFFVFGDRKWRIRPMAKNATSSELRVHVIFSRETDPGAFFVDTVDLYSARHRTSFAKQASEELGVDEGLVRRELGQIVLELEKAREEKARQEAQRAKTTTPAMTDEERREALALLRAPNLLDRLLRDFERAGIVGEETNKLVSYVAATSRKLEEPLAVVIQSSSAAGKSSLMEAVLSLMPDEERVQYSAMTGQSLFYMSGESLKNKILAIVEEEGAERASYALKLLQSEGELTIASTGKDPATGRLVTHTYKVEGPVMIFLTTTAIEVDEELMNRCVVLSVDEGREQTRAIHARQRRAQTLEGLVEREDRQQIRRMHKNAQRLLRPLFVVNPFAMELGFADHTTRTRRDHMKYLTLIRSITLLHQYQRPLKKTEIRGRVIEYVESTREDVALATRYAHAVLGRSLDELPPQTRRLLELVHEMVKVRMEREKLSQREVRFTRRDVREWTRWGNTQLKVHLKRLEELEYVLLHRFGRGPLMNHYELAYGGEGKDGAPFIVGLHAEGSSSSERSAPHEERSGSGGERSGSGRGPVGPRSAGGRTEPGSGDGVKTAANGLSAVHRLKSTVQAAVVPSGS